MTAQQTSPLPTNAQLQDDGTVHYTLLRPVSLEATIKDGPSQITLTKLSFREPTAKGLIDTDLNGTNSAAILGALTGHVGALWATSCCRRLYRQPESCGSFFRRWPDD